MIENRWNRRDILAAGLALAVSGRTTAASEVDPMAMKKIPGSGESLPVVGLGTYQVFDVEGSAEELEIRRKIVELLIDNGGNLLDTSPMYNRSEKAIGDVMQIADNRKQLFLATKVWTNGQSAGVRQMQRSADLMQTEVIDLMQVHNLRDTAVHMDTIREWQADGRIRYSGLTHYTAGAHAALAKEMQQYKPDFIQINYSLGEPEAADRLLPMARDLGVAVLINRPFQSGRLFRAVSGKSVPDWATEFADSWGQFFLKFIISHPAITCVIPATSKTTHMIDNLGAGTGTLPNAAIRQRMLNYFENL